MFCDEVLLTIFDQLTLSVPYWISYIQGSWEVSGSWECQRKLGELTPQLF